LRRTSTGLRALLSILVLSALALLAAPAAAHAVGLSRGEYVLAGPMVTAELVFSRRELAGVVDGLDADADGAVDAAELERGKAALTRAIVDRIDVEGGGARCPGTLDDARLAEEDGLVVHATFRCASPPEKVTVDLAVLEDLPFGHRHLARAVSAGAAIAPVLFRSHRSFEILAGPLAGARGSEGPGAAPAGAAPPGPPPAQDSGKLALFLMGVQHILTGYDHLVFLLGLVLVGGRVRSLVTVVTAFTVAHSMTLAVAVLGVWSPSPRIVEPAIALSIAYVGVENFFVEDAHRRWRITFPFGLIHGFGFAGALREIALPRSEVPAALVLFNLGVEAGQLAVLALVLPLVLWARKRAWFRDVGVKAISAAIVLLGTIWFVLRVV
jgi:hydrogenase/urease accessory protein HupE